jgi:hypothetical protein
MRQWTQSSAARNIPAPQERTTSIMSEIGLFDAMYTARASRRLRPDPVPQELITRVLDAAIRAPSGGNAQNWILLSCAKRRSAVDWLWYIGRHRMRLLKFTQCEGAQPT